MYKSTNPKNRNFDSKYEGLGPLGLVTVYLSWHLSLFADRMCTVLTAHPQLVIEMGVVGILAKILGE